MTAASHAAGSEYGIEHGTGGSSDASRDSVVVTVGPSGVDHYFDVETWPQHGDKAMLSGHRLEYGGMIANSASVLGALGAPTRHLERIPVEGSKGVLDSLREHGVDTGLVQLSPTAALSTAYVIRAQGERTIFIDVDGREVPEVTPEVREALFGATIILSSPAELRDAALLDAVLDAVRGGTRLALDVEHCGLENLQADRALIEEATWVCTNPEALEVLGLRPEASPAGQEILVTEGSRGSTIYCDGVATSIAPVVVDAVDTTGCSDTYFASYLFCRLRDKNIAASGAFAALAAAQAATKVGPRTGAVSLAALDEFAEQMGSQAVSDVRGDHRRGDHSRSDNGHSSDRREQP